MPKEYRINGTTYIFSKDKFQSIVRNTIKQKRASGEKYNAADYYSELATAINSSEETIRKWYSKGGPSPVDIALVDAIADYTGLTDVTDLLEQKEHTNMINPEIPNNPDRELVKTIHTEMLNFAEKLAYGAFNETVTLGDGTEYERWNMNTIFDALIQIHLIIDKSSMDIKTETAKKLHDILLSYTENVTCHEISSKWDPLSSDGYFTAREILADSYNYGTSEEEDEEYQLKEYIKSFYPYVYEDEDEYLEIPFTYQFFYLREFALTLNNVFRNDFPEYFLYE